MRHADSSSRSNIHPGKNFYTACKQMPFTVPCAMSGLRHSTRLHVPLLFFMSNFDHNPFLLPRVIIMHDVLRREQNDGLPSKVHDAIFSYVGPRATFCLSYMRSRGSCSTSTEKGIGFPLPGVKSFGVAALPRNRNARRGGHPSSASAGGSPPYACSYNNNCNSLIWRLIEQ